MNIYFKAETFSREVNFGDIIEYLLGIKRGDEKEQIDYIHKLKNNNATPEQIRKAKSKLPIAYFNCSFRVLSEGASKENVDELTNLMYLDIDNVENYEETKALLLNSDFSSSIFTIYKSSSGKGIHFVIGWENDNVTIQNYSKLFRHITLFIEATLKITLDKTTCNPNSGAYMSYDPDIYINEDFEPLAYEVTKEELLTSTIYRYKTINFELKPYSEITSSVIDEIIYNTNLNDIDFYKQTNLKKDNGTSISDLIEICLYKKVSLPYTTKDYKYPVGRRELYLTEIYKLLVYLNPTSIREVIKYLWFENNKKLSIVFTQDEFKKIILKLVKTEEKTFIQAKESYIKVGDFKKVYSRCQELGIEYDENFKPIKKNISVHLTYHVKEIKIFKELECLAKNKIEFNKSAFFQDRHKKKGDYKISDYDKRIERLYERLMFVTEFNNKNQKENELLENIHKHFVIDEKELLEWIEKNAKGNRVTKKPKTKVKKKPLTEAQKKKKNKETMLLRRRLKEERKQNTCNSENN